MEHRRDAWDYLLSVHFQTLYRRGVATGRRDAKRLKHLERDLVAAVADNHAILDEYGRDPKPKRSMGVAVPALPGDAEGLTRRTIERDAILAAWEARSADRKARLDRVHVDFERKVDDYSHWLERRLIRVM